MGGGDLLSPDSKLEELLLDLAGKARPRVAFLPTAVADSGERTELFLEAFRNRDCEPEVVTLFGMPERSVERVAAADVVYVHGGNTANMLAVWRVHGIDWALREGPRVGSGTMTEPVVGGYYAYRLRRRAVKRLVPGADQPRSLFRVVQVLKVERFVPQNRAVGSYGVNLSVFGDLIRAEPVADDLALLGDPFIATFPMTGRAFEELRPRLVSVAEAAAADPDGLNLVVDEERGGWFAVSPDDIILEMVAEGLLERREDWPADPPG